MILSKKEFAEKFGLTVKYLCPSNEKHIIKGLEQRGYSIKCYWAERNTTFEIEEKNNQLNNNEIWKEIPFQPGWYVSNQGRIKNSQGKFFQGTNDKGYRRIRLASGEGVDQTYFIHRLVKMTFDPIPDADILSVDHINGKRDDNRLENLRWVFQSDNCKLFDENNRQIKEIIPLLIQKFGYEKTRQKIQNLLNDE